MLQRPISQFWILLAICLPEISATFLWPFMSSFLVSRSASRWVSLSSSHFGHIRFFSSHNETNSFTPIDSIHPISVLDVLNQCADPSIWSNRILLQNKFSLPEKGWQVDVLWKKSPHYGGIGVYANQDISAGTLLRIGRVGKNLFPFTSAEEIESFCGNDLVNYQTSHLYTMRLNYVKDYLWGYYSHTDARGYPLRDADDERFFGMWIPGNGLNHHSNPNTVYRDLAGGPFQQGIQLVALTDIAKGEELLDDYKRHGPAPTWLRVFAQAKNITLNFADCNDFVS